MPYNASEKQVAINGSIMRYVELGYGAKPLIVFPGLSDGLKTVQGQALMLGYYYRQFAQEFKVLIFSRKEPLEDGYSTKDMARDQKLALDQLGIEHCYVMGVSQGGMIAQHFAIEYPDMVDKLILAVSASRPNTVIQNTVSKWMQMAEADDYKSLMIDTCEHAYSEKMLKKYRVLYPLISRIGKPKDFSRFLIQARACLTHNTYNDLDRVECPTLIVGGADDKVVGRDASQEMADKIKKNTLITYDGLGHGAYEESKDFNKQVLQFLLNESHTEAVK